MFQGGRRFTFPVEHTSYSCCQRHQAILIGILSGADRKEHKLQQFFESLF